MTMNKPKQEILWTQSYTLTVIAMLFTFIPFSLSLPIFPMYIMDELHGSAQLAGLINAVFLLACVLFRTQTARVERIFGKRNTLTISCLLFCCSYALYLTTTNIVLIIAIRFFSGMCFAICNTALMSIGTQFAPTFRKSEGIAYLSTVSMVGWAIGPFIGLNIVQIWNFNGVFIFCSLILLLGLIILFFINREKVDAIKSANANTRGFTIHDIFEVKALPLCSVVFLIGLTYSGVTSFVAIYAKNLELFSAGGYYFVILAFFSAIARVVVGKVQNPLKANTLLYPCFVIFAIGLLVLGWAQTTVSMLISAGLVGTGFGVATLSTQTIAVHRVSKERTSIVTATYFTFLDFGVGAGAYVLGLCIPVMGYSNLYLVLSPFMLCIAVLYFFVHGRKESLAVA